MHVYIKVNKSRVCVPVEETIRRVKGGTKEEKKRRENKLNENGENKNRQERKGKRNKVPPRLAIGPKKKKNRN